MPISLSALVAISVRDIGAGPPALIIGALTVCSVATDEVDRAASVGDLSTAALDGAVAILSALANGEATGFIGTEATRLTGSVERAKARAAGVGRLTNASMR